MNQKVTISQTESNFLLCTDHDIFSIISEIIYLLYQYRYIDISIISTSGIFKPLMIQADFQQNLLQRLLLKKKKGVGIFLMKALF